jgi:hypothetical protein
VKGPLAGLMSSCVSDYSKNAVWKKDVGLIEYSTAYGGWLSVSALRDERSDEFDATRRSARE